MLPTCDTSYHPGKLSEEGRGVAKDKGKAREWYKKADEIDQRKTKTQ
jgi:TPR repeat protein